MNRTSWCFYAVIATWGCATPGVDSQELRVFFGNLHSHTSYSDGSGTPDDAYRHARHTAHLDFLAITEHNHIAAEGGAAADRQDGILIARNPSLYTGPQAEALIPAANRWTVDREFVALFGQEFSSISKGNHVNVFEVSRVIDVPNGRFDQLLEWLDRNKDSSGEVAIVQFNHPADFDDPSREYGADDFGSTESWIKKIGAVASLMEVVNGPAMTKSHGLRPSETMEADYSDYLNKGFYLAPCADQDNHYFTWGTATDARTGVIADALTKPKILKAMRDRHVYATEDKNLRLIVKVNDHLCGDRISPPAPGSALRIVFALVDDDEPDAEYRIEVFADKPGGGLAQVVEEIAVTGNTPPGESRSLEDVHYAGGRQYFFFKVTQLSEHGESDRAWTAPVWFEPATPPPPTTEPGEARVRIVRLLPDPVGDETQNEEVTLKNLGRQPADLAGWIVEDVARTKWKLDSVGMLNPGEEKCIRRSGQGMALNNSGDTVHLKDAGGRILQTVTYQKSPEGTPIEIQTQ